MSERATEGTGRTAGFGGRSIGRHLVAVTAGWVALAGLSLPASAEATAPAGDASALLRLQESPADSIHRAARSALEREDYRAAARLFGEIADSHPESDHGPDALYWKAFALYRAGDGEALRAAREALRRQQEAFPRAAARSDNRSLLVRVQGKLAERGDPEAARQVISFSDGVLEAGETVVRAGDGEAELARMEAEGIRLGPGSELRGLPRVAVGTRQEADDACPGDRSELRAEALQALHRYDEDRALAMIETVLAETDPCSEQLRKSAVYLLSRYEPDQARSLLLETARQDPSDPVREQALHALVRLDPAGALPIFRQILRNPADSALHEAAVHAAWRTEGEASEELLRSVAGDPDMSREVRENAVWGLARRGGAESRRFLRDLFGQVQDTEIKERILFGLLRSDGEDGDGAAVGWALDVAEDGSQPMDVREAALYLAGRKETVPVERLFGLYDQIDETELKERLIVLYARRESPEARDRLIRIARTEEDPQLRRSAVFWLARSGDERAADVLEEIIAPSDSGG